MRAFPGLLLNIAGSVTRLNLRGLAALFLVALLGAIAFSASAETAQTDTVDGQRTIEQFRRLWNSETSEEPNNAIDQDAPVFIFLPGIMGSAIFECDSDDRDDCKEIWGRKNFDELLTVDDLSIKSDKFYKTEPLGGFKVAGNATDIYGSALQRIAQLRIANGQTILPFSYDWRRSNADSAEKLHLFLCDSSEELGKRPITLVAHSMGGLVAKLWFEYIYKTNTVCDNKKPLQLNIERFIFLGTPHQGAATSLKAFANGFDLSEEGGGVFGYLKNTYRNEYIAQALNDSGGFFPSGFQLLPYDPMSCLSGRASANVVKTTENGSFEVFDYEAWKAAGWPKTLKSTKSRDDYYGSFLKKELSQAQAVVCRVMKFDAGDVPVTYYYSDIKDTETAYSLKKPTRLRGGDDSIGLNNIATELGDGTVPAFSAMNRRVDTDIRHEWRRADEEHRKLLNSNDLFQQLYHRLTMYEDRKTAKFLRVPSKRTELKRRLLQNTDNSSTLALNYLPVPATGFSADRLNDEDYRLIGQFNADLMRARKQSRDDLINEIAHEPSVSDRNSLSAILASIDDADNTVRSNDVIRVGILHSLTGTLAPQETMLKDGLTFLIEQQNRKGGLLGKKLVPFIEDGASDWPLFAEKANALLGREVSVIFGGWTSSSRKSMLPVIEEGGSILFYPADFEGEESSRNIFYTGSAPNQLALPVIDFIRSQETVERWVLLGTDYVFPRVTNKIIKNYLISKGTPPGDIVEQYFPFDFSDWGSMVSKAKVVASGGKRTAIISTISGESNVAFYAELMKQGINPRYVPVASLSLTGAELAKMHPKPLAGSLFAQSYFSGLDVPDNRRFKLVWQLNDAGPIDNIDTAVDAHYVGFNLWVKAVEKAGTTDRESVREALIQTSVESLSGQPATIAETHYITKSVFVAEMQENGHLEIVWRGEPTLGDPWSDYLEDSKDLISDWRKPMSCGNFNVATGKCGGNGP